MLGWLLNLAYVLFLLLCSPILLFRAIGQGKYRSGWGQKLWGNVPEPQSGAGPRIWLHAVSVGEVLQLRQIIEQLRSRQADVQVIVSTTTQTGYQVAHEKLPNVHVIYFPLDFTWSVSRAIERIRPDLIVLVELEVWPNFLRTAFAKPIPVGLINGRLSARSFRGYRRIRFLLAPLLRQLAFVAVQSEEYAERFRAMGTPDSRCHVTGSIKFDGVRTSRDQPLTQELKNLFQIQDGDSVLIAGSTQDPEESLALDIYQQLLPDFPNLRLILVPRHPERGADITRLVGSRNLPLVRRSQPKAADRLVSRPVGLLDTVGELGACWGLADIAFVGGSFGNRGGQNMLEPAAYGAAVCFGPNTWNFRQIVELLTNQQAVRVLQSPDEFTSFVREMLTNRAAAIELGQRAQQLVLSQQGATQRTVDLIHQNLPVT